MNERVVRSMLRLATAGMVFVAVSGPATAAAQSVDIWPGQNIQQIVNGWPAGTTFYLKAGVHRMQTIIPRSWDRFVGEAGTVLSGARQLTSFGRSGAYWFASGQTQQGPRNEATCDSGYPRCAYPEDLYFDGLPLRHVDSIGAVGPGTFFFDYNADRIYFYDDPTNRLVEASVTAQAFTGWATDVLISGLVVEKFASPVGTAAMGVGTRWTLQYSEVKLNHYAGVGTGDSARVAHTSIHHNGAFGMIGAGNYATVENNEISYNNYARFFPYWGSGGTKFVHTYGLTVRGNFSHHNGGPGLWTDIGNIYTLYENNTVEDNERGGIFHELSYDATIRYNTARRNGTPKPWPYWTTGAGIEILDAPNVEVYGNVLEDNWQGITGLDDHRGNGPYGPYTLTESLRARQLHRLACHRLPVEGGPASSTWTATPPTPSGTIVSRGISTFSVIPTVSISSGSASERSTSGRTTDTMSEARWSWRPAGARGISLTRAFRKCRMDGGPQSVTGATETGEPATVARSVWTVLPMQGHRRALRLAPGLAALRSVQLVFCGDWRGRRGGSER